jgi:hypothetical protein
VQSSLDVFFQPSVENLLQREWINGQVLSQRRVEVEREKERKREKVREQKMREVRLGD